ncbi:MAG: cyclopropane-fatty-acyl-phospholipid synthase family protein [Pseudomonadota bacterium]|nr:cyclopropane-fatty-acyl-phospholipid synthase family protein [Pseudomonadota bacterium]
MIHEFASAGLSDGKMSGSLFERMAVRVGKRLLTGAMRGSLRLTLPSGRCVLVGEKDGEAEAELRMNNFALVRKALRRGSLGFAESYIDGDIETPDLVSVFRFFVRNEKVFAQAGRGFFKVRGMDRLAHLLRRNSLGGSRRNIAEHYDLGNAFFAAWLDGDLNYSSGVYEEDSATLEQAQAAKQDLVIDMLGVKPGERVLEIGCGWGAVARRIARLGADITGITLSREQLAHARALATREEHPDRMRFLLQDYRNTSGQFDRVVSVEMIEAVGESYWKTYFRTLHDRLRPGGVAAIQAITIDEKRFDAYHRSTDFIQRYIFPGGMLPTKTIIADQARQAGLEPEGTRCFAHGYARTLREWRRRFDAVWPSIAAMGFDEQFRRMWRYYLAYCEAGFLDGMIDVGVYRLKRPGVTA